MPSAHLIESVSPGVPDLPYYTPAHAMNPGTPTQSLIDTPTLFRPLTIRSKTLRNRIIVAPMCQYSAASEGPDTGKLTDWHVATLGHYAVKGAALVFTEATGVLPNGRITPHCPGLWSDTQTQSFKRVFDFIKSQGALAGIQLAHAGRKSSTLPPWLSTQTGKPSMRASKRAGGWPEDVVGPMGGLDFSWDGKIDDSGFYPPRQLSIPEIQEIIIAFGNSARRAFEAGVDVIEIHAAHGYLIYQFLSPITNHRTDRYGGSFENRTRLLMEIIEAIRAQIPADMPLFVRTSSTEWMEGTDLGRECGSWTVECTMKLAALLPATGVDLLDVSSGGNHPQQQINMMDSKDYQTKIAGRIRRAMRGSGLQLLIGAVGLITTAEQARDIVQDDRRGGGDEPMADVVLIGRQFLREPGFVLRAAHTLGVDVAWPSQFWKVRYR
jgi:2,4-dienoyl-CoA reductase-like NADH-dependent reductase (Old Yellow Enzyme family)